MLKAFKKVLKTGEMFNTLNMLNVLGKSTTFNMFNISLVLRAFREKHLNRGNVKYVKCVSRLSRMYA